MINKACFLILAVNLLLPFLALAQHNNSELPTSVRSDGMAPDSSAMLEVQDTTKGVLFSRMDSVQREAITNPATGLLVYQTDAEAGFYFYDGTEWIQLHGKLDAEALLGYHPSTDLSCISVSGSLGAGFLPISMAVSGDYAYVVDHDSTCLKVIDVSNPAAPVLSGSLVLGITINAIAVSGDYAYVVDYGFDDLKVIDVSNPAAPVYRGNLFIGPSPWSVAVSDAYAYVVDYDSDDLKVIDVSNPAAPVLSGSLGIGSHPLSVAVSGDYAYVVDVGSDDLKVIDVSNPTLPVLSGSLGIGSSPSSVAVSGGYAYVVDQGSDDLKVIDVSNPAAPVLSGSLGIGSSPYSVAVSGDYAYVVDEGSDDLKVIDVSNPAVPVLSGSLGFGHSPWSVAVSGDYAYVLEPNIGDDLFVIDVSGCGDPSLTIDPLSGQVVEGPAVFWDNDGHNIYNVNSGNVGIGTNAPQVDLHISGGNGSVNMLLEADINNSGEQNQPSLTFSQDGGAVKTRLGYLNGENHFSILQDNNSKITFWTDSIRRMTIDDSGNVGIGTSDPGTDLSVIGNVRGAKNTNENEYVEISHGGSHGYINTVGDGNLDFRHDDNTLMSLTDAGYVGIGITNPTQPLHMGGGAVCLGGHTWFSASDRSKKRDIAGMSYGLEEIMSMRPASYRYKIDNSPSIGFIAQEMERIIPEVVSGEEGEKGIAYGLLTSVLVKAIQQQQQMIDKQQEQIKWLMKQFEEMNQ
jgi:hypothetical protein